MGKNTKALWDFVIIGAGAAGMMTAITAARRGKQVLILEKLDKAGKKLYATGNGKCNFTNQNMNASCFHGDEALISHALDSFSVEDCLQFFTSIGITPKDKNGYIYPNSEQAASLVTALLTELKRLQVSVEYNVSVTDFYQKDTEIRIVTGNKEYRTQKLVIATGLKASPKLGSDGSMFHLIKECGHRFRPVLPALCGYFCKGLDFKKVSGVRVHGTVSAHINGQTVATDTGEIQFTDYGLSGIPVFQISHYLSEALYDKNQTEIQINFLPEWDEDEITKQLTFRQNLFKQENVGMLLNGLLPQKLTEVLLSKANISYQTLCKDIPVVALHRLAGLLRCTMVTVTGYRDYEFAQICTGGIPASQINIHTFESQLIPQVYFAGEILDVDGICGGYNLHFAWATGAIVGRQ